MKKFLFLILCLGLLPTFSSCSSTKKETTNKVENEKIEENKESKESKEVEKNKEATNEKEEQFENLRVAMVTDISGINDRAFNQSGYEGLMNLQKTSKAKVSYIESKQRSHFGDNLQKLTDSGNDIVWAMGILFTDDVKDAAIKNPEQVYGLVDYDFNNEVPENVISLIFKDNESSFLIGYIAAKTTKTNKIGFIGGMKCAALERFEYGFRAGAKYAEKELGKKIDIVVEYINSFIDDALAKAKALVLYENNVDIIYAAVGPATSGVIEAAKDVNKFVCGVDNDLSYLAPNNVIISSIKCTGDCMVDVSKRLFLGEDVKGKVLSYGLKENGVAISKYEGSTEKLIDKEVYDKAMEVSKLIVENKIIVPENEKQMEEYLNTIK